MSRIIHFKCRSCDAEIATPVDPPKPVTCASCGKAADLRPNASAREGVVTACASCGHEDLYIQKDFNRNVGVFIVVVGVLFSFYFFTQREPMFAMLALASTAVIDLVIYNLVGEVTVCYACHSIYRGFKRNPRHEAFDLKNLEKYGGRTPRW